MGQRRHPADRADERADVGEFGKDFAHVSRPAAAEEPVERIIDRPGQLPGNQSPRHVRASHRPAGRFPIDIRLLERKTEFLDGLHHGVAPLDPELPKASEFAAEAGIVVGQEIAEQVELTPVAEDGKLASGDDANPVASTGRHGLGHAGHRIVVGEGDDRETRLGRETNNLRRWKAPIGGGAVRVEIRDADQRRYPNSTAVQEGWDRLRSDTSSASVSWLSESSRALVPWGE